MSYEYSEDGLIETTTQYVRRSVPKGNFVSQNWSKCKREGGRGSTHAYVLRKTECMYIQDYYNDK